VPAAPVVVVHGISFVEKETRRKHLAFVAKQVVLCHICGVKGVVFTFSELRYSMKGSKANEKLAFAPKLDYFCTRQQIMYSNERKESKISQGNNRTHTACASLAHCVPGERRGDENH
jgi:hypothetical protein